MRYIASTSNGSDRTSSRAPGVRACVASALSLAIFLFPHETYSEVYKWTDSKGRTHYSSTPVAPGSKEAELPPIQKQDFDKRIRRIRENTPENCLNHGGIDCSLGPDSDGSVICLDGYRDAVGSYVSLCSEVKLQPEALELFDRHGKPIAPEETNILHRLDHIEFSVRNLSSISANRVSGALTIPRAPYPVKATGPDEIPAYGLAEYRATIAPLMRYLDPNSPESIEKVRFVIRCGNCLTLQKALVRPRS